MSTRGTRLRNSATCFCGPPFSSMITSSIGRPPKPFWRVGRRHGAGVEHLGGELGGIARRHAERPGGRPGDQRHDADLERLLRRRCRHGEQDGKNSQQCRQNEARCASHGSPPLCSGRDVSRSRGRRSRDLPPHGHAGRAWRVRAATLWPAAVDGCRRGASKTRRGAIQESCRMLDRPRMTPAAGLQPSACFIRATQSSPVCSPAPARTPPCSA